MPVKIRLQRQGRKFNAVYSIVVADSRAPRDGKYIETLGKYDPNTNPASIDLDFDRAIEWLRKGAQPTDTCRAILSYKGVLYKKHLLEGVRKGAFDEEEAEKRFQSWMIEKEQKIQAKRDRIKKSKELISKERLEQESKIREEKEKELAKKRSELAEAEAAEQRKAVPEEVTEEVHADQPAGQAEPEVAGPAETAAEPKPETAEAEGETAAEAEKAEAEEAAPAEAETESGEETEPESGEETDTESGEETDTESGEETDTESGEETDTESGKS
ncbi:MAG: 30S ribosomal protein S16 [Bacteroidales bacterium]|nr:30S ribosomal protein S16 [Bacteroidales bacterium]